MDKVKLTYEWNKGSRNPNYGKKHTPESLKKMSAVHKGQKAWNKGIPRTEEVKAKIKAKRALQKPFTIETRKKMSIAHKGRRAWNWSGNSVSESIRIRNSFEMKLWRESIFKRDNWTCTECSQVGGQLNAHHIKPFSLFPELRLAIDNGTTLCLVCHKKTDSFLVKARWDKKQLWIQKTL